MITYLISRGLSDAQMQQLSGREDWKSVSILTLDAVGQAYQQAVQSVSILNDTQQCQKSQSYESRANRTHPAPLFATEAHFSVLVPFIRFIRRRDADQVAILDWIIRSRRENNREGDESFGPSIL
jgi:hypothetical protein